MKKLVLSLSTVALIAASIFVFASCEKEELETAASEYSIQKAEQNNPPRLIYQTHVIKEGGTPITFLGIRIGVGYNLVSRDYSTSYTADGNYEIRHTIITCKKGGHERCRIEGKSYATAPDDDDNEHIINIDSLLSIAETDVSAYADRMMDSIDVKLAAGVTSGQLSSTSSFQTLTGETVILRFDFTWEDGNTQGDAEMELFVYYIEE